MRPVRTLKCSLVVLSIVAARPTPARGDVGLRDDPAAQDVAIAGREVLVARTGAGGSFASMPCS